MPTEILDQLQENKVRALEELIHSYRAAAVTGGGQDETAAIADFIVDEGIGVRQGALRLWDYHWMRALAGALPERREHGAKLRSLLERGSRSLAQGAALARTIAAWSGREVAPLAQLEEQARTFPLWVEECMARWEMVDRPQKPLDRERLARSQAAFERGNCEDVADVLARVEQGGPLVQALR